MRVILVSLLLSICITCYSQLTGEVVSIADGDTFTLLTPEKKQIKIRLHGIDCPEKNQDFGTVAKEYLSDLIFEKTVKVQKVRIDRYRRTIGIVTIDGEVANEKLLQQGLAWHYKKYDQNPKWAALELEARKAKLKIWSLKDPVPPWEFRAKKSKAKAVKKSGGAGNG